MFLTVLVSLCYHLLLLCASPYRRLPSAVQPELCAALGIASCSLSLSGYVTPSWFLHHLGVARPSVQLVIDLTELVISPLVSAMPCIALL